MSMLPDYTQLYVFGSHAVEEMVKDLDCTFALVNRVINVEEYNKLLTSFEFWNVIEEENILIFQHDSMLLRKGIEEFYQYDYVGAPWKFCNHGGNGGLSFRHRSSMIAVINGMEMQGQKYNQSMHGNEDVFFCNKLNVYAGLPDREACYQFSCESIFKLGTLGYHAIDKYLSKEQCEQIRNQYK
jgi:hypothetical protein